MSEATEPTFTHPGPVRASSGPAIPSGGCTEVSPVDEFPKPMLQTLFATLVSVCVCAHVCVFLWAHKLTCL